MADLLSTDFRDFGFSDINILAEYINNPHQIGNPYHYFGAKLTDAQVNTMSVFKDNLFQLEQSINDYDPAWWQWIIDLFTLQWCRLNRLRDIVPMVQAAIQEVLNDYPKKIEHVDPVSLTATKSDEVAKEKLALVQQAYEYFQKNGIPTQANAMALSAAEKLQDQVRLAKLAKKTTQAVEEQFGLWLPRLINGENIPLPMWFHATKDQQKYGDMYGDVRRVVDIILDEGELKPFRAISGTGVFFSTSDESHTGYGSYTFAVDGHNALWEQHATYFAGGQKWAQDIYDRLWVAVEDGPVKLNDKNVAYLIYKDGTAEQEEEATQLASRIGVPAVARTTSDAIRHIFQQVTDKIALPKIWKISSKYAISPIPAYLQAMA